MIVIVYYRQRLYLFKIVCVSIDRDLCGLCTNRHNFCGLCINRSRSLWFVYQLTTIFVVCVSIVHNPCGLCVNCPRSLWFVYQSSTILAVCVSIVHDPCSLCINHLRPLWFVYTMHVLRCCRRRQSKMGSVATWTWAILDSG